MQDGIHHSSRRNGARFVCLLSILLRILGAVWVTALRTGSFLSFGANSPISSLSLTYSREQGRIQHLGKLILRPAVNPEACWKCMGPAYRSSFSRNKDVSLRRGFDFEGCKNPRRSRNWLCRLSYTRSKVRVPF